MWNSLLLCNRTNPSSKTKLLKNYNQHVLDCYLLRFLYKNNANNSFEKENKSNCLFKAGDGNVVCNISMEIPESVNLCHIRIGLLRKISISTIWVPLERLVAIHKKLTREKVLSSYKIKSGISFDLRILILWYVIVALKLCKSCLVERWCKKVHLLRFIRLSTLTVKFLKRFCIFLAQRLCTFISIS